MRRFTWIVALTLFLQVQVASVQGQNPCYSYEPRGLQRSCDLCDFDYCDIEYSLYSEFLCWKLCRSELNFEYEDQKEGFFNPDWDSGFRFGGVAQIKNWDFGLRYTYYFTEQSRTPPSGKVKYRVYYDTADIELGYSCCLGPESLTIRPIAGAKLAWIKEKYDKSENSDQTLGRLEFEGYGIYLGASGRWDLCSFCICHRNVPIALVTRASTGILHGEIDIEDLENAEHDKLKDERLYIPVHELFVGLDFTFCNVCCLEGFFQVGYEVQSWSGWREIFSDDDIASWGLGGLVLRLGVSF